MKNDKYRLILEDYKIMSGKKLYRIEALKNFGPVETGDLGGYIESENNLSCNSNAWIWDGAYVYDNARIYDNAIIIGNAMVYGNARVYDNVKVGGNARVYGDAIIYDNVWIYGDARIYNNAWIRDNTRVYNNAHVYGNAIIEDNAIISGDARIYDNTRIYNEAWIRGNAKLHGNMVVGDDTDWLVVGPIGSRDDFTTFALGKDKNIYVSCGCFYGNIEEFEKAVEKTHAGTKYKEDYQFAIAFATSRLETIKPMKNKILKWRKKNKNEV